jgi:isopenicillin N synthase-like dioxygenase
MSEELVWRAMQSFEWEERFGDAKKVLADAHRAIAGELRQAMRDAGFTPISTPSGIQWAEPDSAIAEAVRKLTAEMMKEGGS